MNTNNPSTLSGWADLVLGALPEAALRSPIVAIAHLRLCCRPSFDRLRHDALWDIRTLVNRYPLRYWLRLMPLPGGPKRTVASLPGLTGFDRVRFGINVGNLFAIGRRPW